MVTYEYRCACTATATIEQPMRADGPPESVPCPAACGERAMRVWSAPAAIHFRGPGFYSTDVKGRTERRRRPNPGDDLHREHDPAADFIARHA